MDGGLASAPVLRRLVTSIRQDDQRQCLELVIFGLRLKHLCQLTLSLGAPCLLQFHQANGAELLRLPLRLLPILCIRQSPWSLLTDMPAQPVRAMSVRPPGPQMRRPSELPATGHGSRMILSVCKSQWANSEGPSTADQSGGCGSWRTSAAVLVSRPTSRSTLSPDLTLLSFTRPNASNRSRLTSSSCRYIDHVIWPLPTWSTRISALSTLTLADSVMTCPWLAARVPLSRHLGRC